MAEIVMGQYVVDLIKLVVKQIDAWRATKRKDADIAIDYVGAIAKKLDTYVDLLVAGADADADEFDAYRAARKKRTELDRVLLNLGYVLEDKVDDKLLKQMSASLRRAKIADGALIPELGHEDLDAVKLKGRERLKAIDGLVKASGEIRAIADALRVQAGRPFAKPIPDDD